jgi:hypothetical protein
MQREPGCSYVVATLTSYGVSMRVSVEKLFSHTAVDAPNVSADAQFVQ